MLTQGLEDYLEAILVCQHERGVVRTKHIADQLKVKSPSVNAAVKELRKLGLVNHEAYGHIELTEEGTQEAQKVLLRHNLLCTFFGEFLNIPTEIAHKDACAVEHDISDETVEKLKNMIGFLNGKLKHDPPFREEYWNSINCNNENT
jgi:DtxR family Mn-dependent transcriptional regulator